MDEGRTVVAASASLGWDATYGHLCQARLESWVCCLPARLSLLMAVGGFLGRGQKKQGKGIKMIKTVCLTAAPGFLSVIRE